MPLRGDARRVQLIETTKNIETLPTTNTLPDKTFINERG
jgi:hypothetical protein